MSSVGVIGYATSALAFLLLTTLLIVAWEGRSQGVRLIVASAVTALWGAWLARLSQNANVALAPVALAEVLRNGIWLVVLAQLAHSGHLARALRAVSYLVSFGLLLAVVVAAVIAPDVLPTLAIVSGLALPLLGLVLLEQAYRNSGPSGRWSLLHLYVGLGGIFVYDVFLYSQALLLDGLSQTAWLARGFVTTLAVPFIIVAARRNTAWSLQVFVSRDVVFHTTTFLAIGGYLLLMAAGGYLVRLVGGSWGAVGQVVFLAAAVAVLIVLVGSTALRQRLRVFLVKHFYRNKYDYREEWLRFIGTLSSGPGGEPPQVTAVRAVAQIIGSEGAALLMPGDSAGKWCFAAAWPVADLSSGAPPEPELGAGMLEWLGKRHWVVDLAEYRRDPAAYDGLDVPDWMLSQPAWRLVVPVMLGEQLYAVLLLQEPPQRFDLTFEDRDLLKTVARHVATHVAQHDYERKLAEGREFAAFNRLAAFMTHDLKNAVAQLELVVANAGQHKRNPDFVDDVIETVSNTAARISRLIEHLQRGGIADDTESLDLATIVAGAAERAAVREPRPGLHLPGKPMQLRASRERLSSVIEHVIRNAQEATTPAGKVEVSLGCENERALVEVRDDGVGMSAEFIRTRLFQPFESTKGSKGMGIGAFQAREYVRSLGGTVEVVSAPGEGTLFRILLPVENAADRREQKP